VVSGESTDYTSVTGSWPQPAVTCGANDAGASAFWVGLGGYFTGSQALEQVGTSSNCDSATGKPSYYAWYELVPSDAVTIKKLKVAPGDLITTSVNVVGGNSVVVQVKNRSHGTNFTTTLPFANPDLTSAEWVAEAPAACSRYRCSQISLSNFGSVQFTRLAALGNTLGGTLTANPGWTTTAVSLVPDVSRGYFPGPDRFARAAVSAAGASPTAPSSDGRGFSVSWTANAGTS
jgi:Peptidase A4 family